MAQTPDLANDRLGGARGGRAGQQQVGERGIDRRIQGSVALDDLMDESDPLRPHRVEPSAAREQRPGVALADLRDHERADDRRQDPETRLGEPEAGARLRDDEIGHGAQPHPASERRAVDTSDDRCRTRIDHLEHVGHRHGVVLVPLGVEGHRGPHPAEVGAGAERRSVAGQDHRAQLGRTLLCEGGERGSKLGDECGIEGVVDLRAR